MKQVRVYQLAKELQVQSALILELLDRIGAVVKSDLSTLDAGTAELVRDKVTAALETEKARLAEEREIEEALERGYEAEGYRGAMRFVADVLAARSEQGYVSAMTIMQYYIRAGDLEKAVDWAEQAFEQRDLNVPVWGVLPLADVLRGEPRFDAMIRELGFPFDG